MARRTIDLFVALSSLILLLLACTSVALSHSSPTFVLPPPSQPDLATPTPAHLTFSSVPHRFIVGFQTYARWEEHERTFRQLWATLPEYLTHTGAMSPLPLQCMTPNTNLNESRYSFVSNLWRPIEWTVLVRSNPSTSLPTDFLLIQVDSRSAAGPDQIAEMWKELQRSNPKTIKYVMEEKRVTRSLMSTVDVDEELDLTNHCEVEIDDSQAELDAIRTQLLQRKSRQAHTTADMESTSDDSLSSYEGRASDDVGSFPPPQRFDLGRATQAADESNHPPPNLSPFRRKLSQWGAGGNSPTDLLRASTLWDRGFRGGGIRIAIFDTGLSKTHPHFANVDERTNWTDEQTLEDGLGHGTFVAGVIAARRDCLGFAPEARLHIFRVFNQRQLSFTSWFLDAFNYAIHSHVHILNLSIGGPDFLDRPFVEKVNEMSANGITVVSAIGNDGPLWGTLNNPADQMDVIGVGGATEDKKVATFSSRGMTTAELPLGYGRMKPDLVALARNIRGSNQGSGCKTMSGTSVASPVVAGVLTLLASTIPEALRPSRLNPAYLKQLLLESAVRLPTDRPNSPGIFEQGEGGLSLEGAYALLTSQEGGYPPHASIVPPKLDLTDCPYMWPYCTQAIYHTSQPVMLNLTILNSQSVSSSILDPPRFHPADELSKRYLRIRYTYPEVFYPWSGWFGMFLTLAEDVPAPTILAGFITIRIHSDGVEAASEGSVIQVPIKIQAIPTPQREKRILFDAFHNLRYPSGYFPRDNLEVKVDTLDWNGDHVHTNYRELYTFLREKGYYVEVFGRDFTCFDASHYSTLLLIDPEEEYFIEEVSKLLDDVYLEGMNLLVLGEWYNTRVMREIKFYDENTAEWWTPETGGANLPALNSLLAGFGVKLTDHVVKGDINIAGEMIYFASGTTIGKFPTSGSLSMHHLVDAGSGAMPKEYPIMGVYDPAASNSPLAKLYPKSGKLFLYGDSNCVDMNHRRGNLCGPLLLSALQYFETGDRSKLFKSTNLPLTSPYIDKTITKWPRRATGNNLIKYSKVTSAGSMPQCPLMSVDTAAQAHAAYNSEPAFTAVSVYEEAHTALEQSTSTTSTPGAVGPAQSIDDAKANSRFAPTIQKIHQRSSFSRRRRPPIEEEFDFALLASRNTTPSDPNRPSPVLAKQARFNPALESGDEDSPLQPFETEQLFAQSPGEAILSAAQIEARHEARAGWIRIGLLAVIICIILVGYLYRSTSRRQRPPTGKHSPAQVPMPPPKPTLQPRTMVL